MNMVFEDSRSTLDIYMSEISKKPLFTREEEYDAAIEVDRWNKRVIRLEKLAAKTGILARKARKDVVKARLQLSYFVAKMMEGNYRLVVNIAKRYGSYSLQLSDLIEEGNIGLLKAVMRFDPLRGYRFSTFATQWIKQSITKSIRDKGRMIRMPVHVERTLSRYHRAASEYQQKNGCEPLSSEKAGFDEITQTKLNFLLGLSDQVVSLDVKLSDSDSSLENAVIDVTEFSDPQQRTMRASLLENIGSMLEKLKGIEKQIIVMRYGLNEVEPMTLDSIGTILGLTRERVRQIQAAALKKMRNFEDSGELKLYLHRT